MYLCIKHQLKIFKIKVIIGSGVLHSYSPSYLTQCMVVLPPGASRQGHLNIQKWGIKCYKINVCRLCSSMMHVLHILRSFNMLIHLCKNHSIKVKFPHTYLQIMSRYCTKIAQLPYISPGLLYLEPGKRSLFLCLSCGDFYLINLPKTFILNKI